MAKYLLWCLICTTTGVAFAANKPTPFSKRQTGLHLVTTATWSVPDSFKVSGMTASENGEVGLWSSSADYFALLDTDLKLISIVPLPPIDGRLRSVSLLPDQGIELILDEPLRVCRLTAADGKCSSEVVTLEVAGSLVAAGRTSDSWVFLMRTEVGSLLLYAYSEVGGLGSPAPGWADTKTEAYSIATWRDSFTVTQRAFPLLTRTMAEYLAERSSADREVFRSNCSGSITARWYTTERAENLRNASTIITF